MTAPSGGRWANTAPHATPDFGGASGWTCVGRTGAACLLACCLAWVVAPLSIAPAEVMVAPRNESTSRMHAPPAATSGVPSATMRTGGSYARVSPVQIDLWRPTIRCTAHGLEVVLRGDVSAATRETVARAGGALSKEMLQASGATIAPVPIVIEKGSAPPPACEPEHAFFISPWLWHNAWHLLQDAAALHTHVRTTRACTDSAREGGEACARWGAERAVLYAFPPPRGAELDARGLPAARLPLADLVLTALFGRARAEQPAGPPALPLAAEARVRPARELLGAGRPCEPGAILSWLPWRRRTPARAADGAAAADGGRRDLPAPSGAARTPARVGSERCVAGLHWGLAPRVLMPLSEGTFLTERRAAARALRALLGAQCNVSAAARGDGPRSGGAEPSNRSAAAAEAAAGLLEGAWISRPARSRKNGNRFYAPGARAALFEAFRARGVALRPCCEWERPCAALRQLARARVLVGVHGAGLANVLFARRGAVLVELKTGYRHENDLFRKLSQAVGGGYVAVAMNVHGGGGNTGSKARPREGRIGRARQAARKKGVAQLAVDDLVGHSLGAAAADGVAACAAALARGTRAPSVAECRPTDAAHSHQPWSLRPHMEGVEGAASVGHDEDCAMHRHRPSVCRVALGLPGPAH